MIDEYEIVVAEDVWMLVDKVNEKIKKGWQPIGGYVVGETYVGQSMVKNRPITSSFNIESKVSPSDIAEFADPDLMAK